MLPSVLKEGVENPLCWMVDAGSKERTSTSCDKLAVDAPETSWPLSAKAKRLACVFSNIGTRYVSDPSEADFIDAN